MNATLELDRLRKIEDAAKELMQFVEMDDSYNDAKNYPDEFAARVVLQERLGGRPLPAGEPTAETRGDEGYLAGAAKARAEVAAMRTALESIADEEPESHLDVSQPGYSYPPCFTCTSMISRAKEALKAFPTTDGREA